MLSSVLGSCSPRTSPAPGSRLPDQGIRTQGRCVRGREAKCLAGLSLRELLIGGSCISLHGCHSSYSELHVFQYPRPNYEQRILALESECDRYFVPSIMVLFSLLSNFFLLCRLRRSENDLRNELDTVRADACSREEILMQRIQMLDLEVVRRDSLENEHETAYVQVRFVSELSLFLGSHSSSCCRARQPPRMKPHYQTSWTRSARTMVRCRCSWLHL